MRPTSLSARLLAVFPLPSGRVPSGRGPAGGLTPTTLAFGGYPLSDGLATSSGSRQGESSHLLHDRVGGHVHGGLRAVRLRPCELSSSRRRAHVRYVPDIDGVALPRRRIFRLRLVAARGQKGRTAISTSSSRSM